MTFDRKTLLIIASIVFLVAGYFYVTVDWDTRAVRKQFDRLVALIEKDGPVSTFEALGRSRKLTGFFTEEASVEYVAGRRLPPDLDAMGAAFMSVWGRVDAASIRVLRHEVSPGSEGALAESQLTAYCSVVIDGSERMGDTLKYRIFWRKVDGEWRIQSLFPVG